jgi:hypothetical protein
MALPKKLTWKPKTKNQRGPEWKPRRCKCCKLMFVPMDKNPANAGRSKFCTKRCKDRYHNSGGMNIVRFHEVVTRATVKALNGDDMFIEGLSDKLRSKLGPMIREIAREEIAIAYRESGMARF